MTEINLRLINLKFAPFLGGEHFEPTTGQWCGVNSPADNSTCDANHLGGGHQCADACRPFGWADGELGSALTSYVLNFIVHGNENDGRFMVDTG